MLKKYCKFWYKILNNYWNYYKLRLFIFFSNKDCEIFWGNLVKNYQLPVEIIEDNFKYLDKFISYSEFNLDEDIIEKIILSDCWNTLNQILILKYQNVSENILEKYLYKFDFNLISAFKNNISKPFLLKYDKNLNWSLISLKQNICDSIITSNIDNINWYLIGCNNNFKLDFVIKYSSQIDIDSLSRFVVLNKSILKLFEENLNWDLITVNRLISEEILILFSHKIDLNLFKSNIFHLKYIKYYSIDIILKFKPFFNNYYIFINRCKKIQRFVRRKTV